MPERERLAGYDRARHGVHLLRSPQVIAEPSRYIDAIAELGPVFFDEVGSVWVVSGYAEAVEVLRDHHRFSSVREHRDAAFSQRGLHAAADLSAMVHEQMLFLDPPQHGAIRSALAEQFASKMMKSRESDLRQIADQALDGLPSDGDIDLVGDFAAKLPASLVAFLLGMPGREVELSRWAEAYERLLGSLSALPVSPDPEVDDALHEALAQLQHEARARLRAPGNDVISSLVAPLADRRPSDSELFAIAANCIVLVGGGYQTLTHLVTQTLLALHDDPACQQRVRAQPDLIPSSVKEIMRFRGSSQYVARRATTDVTLCGQHITAGQSILVHLAAANLDPTVFTEPRTLDLDRLGQRHLGFGTGRHACPGAGYAERLAAFAIGGFLDRYPAYTPHTEPGAQSWGLHGNTRCLEHAHVHVTATPRTTAPAVTGSPSLPAGRPYAYCWHEVFEEQARLTPEAAAVMWAHGTITYRELDQRANALAHRLRRLGAQPGVVVAVVMERSVEFALAILAIAKSGSAFLLADVTCPRQRLRAMLVEAEVRLVISDGSLPTSTFPAQVIGTGEPAARPDPPMTGATPGDTAYIVFTSGTTGAPKAIAISHEATVNLGLAQRQIFTLGPGDRLLQFLSPNFDGCIADLTLALLSGATLALAPTDRLTVGPPLVRLLGSAKITAVILTPSVWMALPVQQLPHLRTAAAAGERLHATWAQQWAAPGRRLFNLYGPAETAVLATWHECTLSEEPPPIGRPIANKEAYLIDNDLRRVEPGQEGELCIGGTGIGRYLNQPDLMQERFIRDPYTSTRPAGLLYRTGDICRQRPDGTLDYVGRHDRQVKIRGQRLELDEVERVLETAPGVAASRVQEQDGRLHALITAAGQPPDEEAIRSHLATRLHTAMVPATLTTVSELPRTQNGKVSQRATAAATNGHRDHPAPEASAAPMVMPPRCNSPAAPGASTVPSASGTPRKQHSRLTWQITQHFAKALGLPLRQVQTDSDFFTHGGDSLKLASLLQALETLTGAPVDITELITSPTPERIATHLLTEETSS